MSRFLIIGVAILVAAVMFVLFVMMKRCCSESCATNTGCKLAAMMVVFVESIRSANEWFLTWYSAISQASARIRCSPSWSWRYGNEGIAVIGVPCKGWMLSHVWHAGIFVPVIVLVGPSDQPISRLGPDFMIPPTLDLFAIW